MNENQLARKIAELFLASHDEGNIIEIERMLIHYGHEQWKVGYYACAETSLKVIKETFKKETV